MFTNPALEATVALGQVFWLADANATSPERLFLVADRALSVAGDFADFGTEVRALKKRLDGEVRSGGGVWSGSRGRLGGGPTFAVAGGQFTRFSGRLVWATHGADGPGRGVG
ncbi:hypothetical protein [Streptomyces sp. 2A115]|uniref:hypothetical protein n=1 Tax=Streptomyces sp. 2A115 TaxID=3457439 RepID=UPI003FD0E1D7